MARYLALDWDQQHIYLIAASVQCGAVTFQRGVVLPLDEGSDQADMDTVGRRLGEKLQATDAEEFAGHR